MYVADEGTPHPRGSGKTGLDLSTGEKGGSQTVRTQVALEVSGERGKTKALPPEFSGEVNRQNRRIFTSLGHKCHWTGSVKGAEEKPQTMSSVTSHCGVM